eukprot:Hpha_TRINITY_DN15803_c3_g3::TRINITY_DN15803_c3_g3_i2::g.189861::m.189861
MFRFSQEFTRTPGGEKGMLSRRVIPFFCLVVPFGAPERAGNNFLLLSFLKERPTRLLFLDFAEFTLTHTQELEEQEKPTTNNSPLFLKPNTRQLLFSYFDAGEE